MASPGTKPTRLQVFRLRVYERFGQESLFTGEFTRAQLLRDALEFVLKSDASGTKGMILAQPEFNDEYAWFKVTKPGKRPRYDINPATGRLEETGGRFIEPCNVILDFEREILGVEMDAPQMGKPEVIARHIRRRLATYLSFRNFDLDLEEHALRDLEGFLQEIRSAEEIRSITITIKRPNTDYDDDMFIAAQKMLVQSGANVATIAAHMPELVEGRLLRAMEQAADKGDGVAASVVKDGKRTPEGVSLNREEVETVNLEAPLAADNLGAAVDKLRSVLRAPKPTSDEHERTEGET